MHRYEMVLVLSPKVSQEDVPAFMERLGRFLGTRGGSITSVDSWGVRRLAYPIKRFGEGTYLLTKLEMDASVVTVLDANLTISEDVLRHLVIRLDS